MRAPQALNQTWSTPWDPVAKPIVEYGVGRYVRGPLSVTLIMLPRPGIYKKREFRRETIIRPSAKVLAQSTIAPHHVKSTESRRDDEGCEGCVVSGNLLNLPIIRARAG